MKYIVANSYGTYLYWCRERGYAPHSGEYKYVRDLSVLRGTDWTVDVLFVGNWMERADWRELYNYVSARRALREDR